MVIEVLINSFSVEPGLRHPAWSHYMQVNNDEHSCSALLSETLVAGFKKG